MNQEKLDLLRAMERTRAAPAKRVAGPRWLALGLLAVGIGMGVGAGGWLIPRLIPAGSPGAGSAVTGPAAVEPVASTAAGPAPVAATAPAPAGLIASGYVVARRKATVASEITGLVTMVAVEEGMRVEAGQILAELDASLAQRDSEAAAAAVAQAEANLESTEADLADAERIAGRTRALRQRDFATEADLTRDQAHAAVLRATLHRNRAELESARVAAHRARIAVDKYTIRAPFGGIVTDKNAQAGEIISPVSAGGGFTRTGICTLVDMDSLEIEVDVNEAFIGRVTADQPIKAVLDAYPDWSIPGKVIAVIPSANRDKATVKVRIGLGVKDPRTLPDMAVKVMFSGGGPDHG